MFHELTIIINLSGLTSLHHASQNGYETLVRKLVQFGVDIHEKDHEWTSLHHASQISHESVVRLLVELGADIDAKDNE